MLLLTRQFDCKTYIEKLCKKKQRPYSPTAMLIAFFNANFKLVPQFSNKNCVIYVPLISMKGNKMHHHIVIES